MTLQDIEQFEGFAFGEEEDLDAVFMELTELSSSSRIIFSVLVIILLIFSLISNTAALYVGLRSRKIRPFFRTCLTCLATSDLLSSIFSSTTYLSQFTGSYVQVWTLGNLMCSLSPFISTVSILVNSITLVGIAVDRYVSVIRLVRNVWDTRGVYCIIFAIIVWGLSIGIATPSLSAYKHIPVLIFETDPDNATEIISMKSGYLCAASKKESAFYYMILLCLLSIPIAVAFIWFNSVLAYEIWIRRKAMNSHLARTPNPRQHESTSSIGKNEGKPSIRKLVRAKSVVNDDTKKSGSTRVSRQLRMFCIIILLIATFIVFRMPVWIYLILKFYNTYMSTFHWILQYCFGLLSLFGCALNPLLYAFLTQTIHYAVTIYNKTRGCCGLRRLFMRSASAKNDVAVPTTGNSSSKMEIYVIAMDK